MKRITTLFSMAFCITATATAQSYTQHLQEKRQGMGSVTVTQSEEIDKLVNTANVSARQQDAKADTKGKQPSATSANTQQHTSTTSPQHTSSAATHEPAHHEPAPRHETPRKDNASQHDTTPKRSAEEAEEPVVDTRKKVMRRSYKVNGYRVQVFAGGNSRNDKIKAQQAGNSVKAAFPSQPIYVHFYSPRWICRMGNYRTYEEANAILTQVKKMGYKQACIVSGKITVAY